MRRQGSCDMDYKPAEIKRQTGSGDKDHATEGIGRQGSRDRRDRVTRITRRMGSGDKDHATEGIGRQGSRDRWDRAPRITRQLRSGHGKHDFVLFFMCQHSRPALLRPGRLDRKVEFAVPNSCLKRLVFSTTISMMKFQLGGKRGAAEPHLRC